MEIYHGTWVPSGGADFDNGGQFIFWVETSKPKKRKAGMHPANLYEAGKLRDFLSSELNFGKPVVASVRPELAAFHATLPSVDGRPLPSIEMAQLIGEYLPDEHSWSSWEISGIAVGKPLFFLRELQFHAAFANPDFHLGHDLKFWIQYAQQLRNLVRQHQFLPVMKCRRSGPKSKQFDIHSGWMPAAGMYESGLQEFAASMPALCTVVGSAGVNGKKRGQPVECLDRVELLRNFSEHQLETLISDTPFTQALVKQLKGNWLVDALRQRQVDNYRKGIDLVKPTDEDWKQWNSWQKKIVGQSHEASFVLGLRLHQESERKDNDWRLSFFVSSSRDPSLRIDLSDWWELSGGKKAEWLKQFGRHFERNLLVNLGHAARMCPLLWQGIETVRPTGLDIDLDTAYEFLKNDALVLESAGFRIVLPSWWMPQGRRRAKIRIKASGKSSTGQNSSPESGQLDLARLVNYSYELSIAGEKVSAQEWQALVEAKSPLVRFRGEWMEIDNQQMAQMLELWRQQEKEGAAMVIDQLLKDVAEADGDTVEFVFDDVLSDILKGLLNQEDVQPMDDPAGLLGELRTYQKIGLAWLAKQEALGLNPCLADDMGLGKTVQLISLLLHEREESEARPKSVLPPTLLVAPTSVLSNWQKETEKFAPQLRCTIHHGGDRPRGHSEFQQSIAGYDLVVTSFNLARSDSEVLKKINWRRVVVDEAQNIKNPKSAQAKAIFSLPAPHRIAMTGTPIENRLMDIWSLFNFLNPGFLGTAAQFRRAYETPIQRDRNQSRSRQLQRLVQPFILRRLKTDKSIIDDLPEKVEQKVYCNLTTEQASLYQAVVDDVQDQIEDAEGIQRRGLILSTLMKLKQVCNHPAQFLQDGSAFDEIRSHKLTRLNEMIEEALYESDSLLVFTQFTEIGGRLETLFREKHACPVHYLHGGTSRKRREQMIENFQDPESLPGIFVLSLRAGGVGITLTQANHVFHFDRWWNPAVENQATDRAYRIGQEKTVFAHKMITLGTLEERIDETIETKQALADNIVGTDENWLTELDNDSFRELIALNRSTIMEA